MAISPEDFLFALTGALVLASLAMGVALRGNGLAGAGSDFTAALFLCAGAMFGALIAAYFEWTYGSQVLVAAAGAGALLSVGGAGLRVAQVKGPSFLGQDGLRYGLLSGALVLFAFGWGAVVGAPGQGPQGPPAVWVAASVAAAAVIAALGGALAILRARLPPVTGAQVFGGVIGLAVGMVLVGIGAVMTGSAVAIIGGTFVYSAVRGQRATNDVGEVEDLPVPPREGPRELPERRVPARRDGGVKVRVPKGSAARVTRFRDDGLPPGGNP